MKFKYIVILDVGLEEVHYFKNIKEILEYFKVKEINEVKENRWVQRIYKIEEV